MNILTGETGAGKSIIIGSVNVALGAQSFKGFAKEGADYALVELLFAPGRRSDGKFRRSWTSRAGRSDHYIAEAGKWPEHQ